MQHRVRLAKHNSEHRQCGGREGGMLRDISSLLFTLVLSQLSFLKDIHNSGACAIQCVSINDPAFKHYFYMVRMYDSGLS